MNRSSLSPRRARSNLAASILVASRLAAVVALLGASMAAASDFADECRSANGAFERIQGVLYDGYAEPGADPAEIPHEVLSETVLRERAGYCEAAGNEFPWSATLSVVTVRAQSPDLGEIDVDLLCEVLSDGLPAALGCEREVVTREGGILP